MQTSSIDRHRTSFVHILSMLSYVLSATTTMSSTLDQDGRDGVLLDHKNNDKQDQEKEARNLRHNSTYTPHKAWPSLLCFPCCFCCYIDVNFDDWPIWIDCDD